LQHFNAERKVESARLSPNRVRQALASIAASPLTIQIALQSSEKVPMTVYDYICNACKKSFETVLTLAEHDKERISCPHCGSKNVEQEAAAFFAVTGKKS
jgi:putative FmdB family regulatory protein